MAEKPNYQYDWNSGLLQWTKPDGDATVGAIATEFSGNTNSPAEFNVAIKSVYAYYKKTNRLETLKTKLENAFGAKISKVGDQTFMQLLTRALQETTSVNWMQGANNPQGSVGQQISVMQWLDSSSLARGGSGGSGQPSPEKFIELTGRTGAWRTFSEATKQLTGLTPNKKDFEEYFKALNAAEKKSWVTRKQKGLTQTTVGNAFDINSFTLNFIVNKIDLANPNLKNAASETKQLVEQTINDNGVEKFFSNSTKNKLIRNLMNGSISQDELNNTVRNQAMLAHSAWADEMKANPMLSFKDIISPYREQYMNTLELTGNVDINHVAQLAVKDGKRLSSYDYQKALRDDPRWARTRQANVEAADMAKAFARAFGVDV